MLSYHQYKKLNNQKVEPNIYLTITAIYSALVGLEGTKAMFFFWVNTKAWLITEETDNQKE